MFSRIEANTVFLVCFYAVFNGQAVATDPIFGRLIDRIGLDPDEISSSFFEGDQTRR
jgi:hypothetical protein